MWMLKTEKEYKGERIRLLLAGKALDASVIGMNNFFPGVISHEPMVNKIKSDHSSLNTATLPAKTRLSLKRRRRW